MTNHFLNFFSEIASRLFYKFRKQLNSKTRLEVIILTTTIRVPQSYASHYSRTVALLLCLFLGGFGAHRFYVGKSGSAVLMLILSLCGVGWIWSLIDLIMILTGSFTDDHGRYVSSWDGGPQQATPVVTVTTHSPPQKQAPTYPVPPPPQKQADEMFCNTCGALCKKAETFCRNCGAALQK